MVLSQPYRLSRAAILSLRSSVLKIATDTRQLIARLGCGRRGCRAGQHCLRSLASHYVISDPLTNVNNSGIIPVIVGRRSTVYADAHVIYRGVRGVRRPARKTIRRVCRSTPLCTNSKFGVFNAGTIGNKFTVVSQWITDNRLLFAAIVETWHDASNDPTLIACTPAGYCCVDRARPLSDAKVAKVTTNHGGVCLFYRRSLHVRSVAIKDYSSFEHVCVYIKGSSLNFLVVVIYRPGSVTATDVFFDDFTDLLVRVSTYSSPLLIVGDINIHLDVKSDSLTIKFDDLLAAHGLIQHVQSPTHRCGHLLDVVITRSDMSITALCVDPPSLSDHSMIVGEIGFATLNDVDEFECLHRRCWRQFDLNSFTADLERSVATML